MRIEEELLPHHGPHMLRIGAAVTLSHAIDVLERLAAGKSVSGPRGPTITKSPLRHAPSSGGERASNYVRSIINYMLSSYMLSSSGGDHYKVPFEARAKLWR